MHKVKGEGLGVLRTYRQFQEILKQGYNIVTPAFVLYKIVGAETGPVIYGIIASRKVGGAVVRNRCKRRLRVLIAECARTQEMPAGTYVFIARSQLFTYDFEKLLADFKRALTQKGKSPEEQALYKAQGLKNGKGKNLRPEKVTTP